MAEFWSQKGRPAWHQWTKIEVIFGRPKNKAPDAQIFKSVESDCHNHPKKNLCMSHIVRNFESCWDIFNPDFTFAFSCTELKETQCLAMGVDNIFVGISVIIITSTNTAVSFLGFVAISLKMLIVVLVTTRTNDTHISSKQFYKAQYKETILFA